MKKKLKILLPILVIIGMLLFFKNDLMLWNLLNKYETDPSSINPNTDVPEARCVDAQEEIFKTYLAKKTLSEEHLATTVKLIEFFRVCVAEVSAKEKKPLDKKVFDVLMDIYTRTENADIHQDIASFLRKEDINAFYSYFEMTQENDLLFYSVTSYSPVKYPELLRESSATEKDLWCKKVQPKIEAEFVALIQSDTLINSIRGIELLNRYEKVNCTNNPYNLRKFQFSAWSKLLANLEKEFYASKNSKKSIDFRDLINESHRISREPKNELESTSFYALLSLETEEEKKDLLFSFFDSPIESRIMCWKIVFYVCYEYGTSMDKDIIKKAKAWQKLVIEKYPDFPIEKEWEDQMGMAKLKEVYKEHGEF